MTNKPQFKAGLKIPMDKELNRLMPPGGPEFDDTDVVVSLGIDSPISELSFELGATLLIPTPFNPLKAAGMIKIEIKMSTESGNTFTLTVGAGVGVSFNVGGFGCTAYFMETMFLVAGDSTLGFGVGLIIKGSIDLEIISIDVSVEAKMAILKVTCPIRLVIVYVDVKTAQPSSLPSSLSLGWNRASYTPACGRPWQPTRSADIRPYSSRTILCHRKLCFRCSASEGP